ncbi:MAG: hypothetical protein AAGA77_02065 [Bacteroidota bacterium]
MKYSFFMRSAIAICFLVIVSCNQKITDTSSRPIRPTVDLSGKTLTGASVLAFGANNVLFIGDSKASKVYAIPTTAKAVKDPVPFNNFGIDRKIAIALGVSSSDLIINDMQIHPVSQEAYIAFKNGHAPNAKSLIAVISPTNNNVRFLDLTNAEKQQVSLKEPHTEGFNFYRDLPSSTLNITDIDYLDGFIYVAGLTNGEFASTLRKIKYPFDGNQSKVASIEMYHAVHTQNETRAPIRTMTFEEINGESTLIAAYTCTPLVSIPTSDINEGNHVKAKTIAELGFGNTPIDMITFMAQEQDGSFDKKLLITNKQRSASLISLKDFTKANEGKGMDSGFTMGPEGVNIFPVPMAGVMQISDQNQMMLSVLRRNMDTGAVDLISKMKGAYFRLSDFASEYEFPEFTHRDGDPWFDYQNAMKQMEGFPELMKTKQ